MKILLVNKFHYPKGGSETYYFGLGKLLRNRGNTVLYFSMKDGRNRPCGQERYFVDNVDFNTPMSGVRTAKTALKMLYSFEAKKKMEMLIRDEKPDVIHLNIFQSQLTGSIVDAARKHHIPVVYTAHDLKSICPNYQMLNHGEICEKCLHGDYFNCFRAGCMKDSRAKSLLAAMEAEVYKWRKVYQKMDLIITPSAFYAKKLRDAEITPCPIVHMPNFLPEDTRYGGGAESGSYFLYFGRLSREKGLLTLIDAYSRAEVRKPLYIVGDGPLREQLEERIGEKNLRGRVKMLGYRAGEELRNIVANALCVCLPSEWYENGPYSIMEAQAAGRPVIVSDNGGLPELVEDGVTGYIVKPKDPEDLAAKLTLCEQKRDWDRERIARWAKQRYDPQKYGERLQSIYEKLCEDRENTERDEWISGT